MKSNIFYSIIFSLMGCIIGFPTSFLSTAKADEKSLKSQIEPSAASSSQESQKVPQEDFSSESLSSQEGSSQESQLGFQEETVQGSQDQLYIDHLTAEFKKSVAYQAIDLSESKGDVDYVNDSVFWTIVSSREQSSTSKNIPKEELIKSLYSTVLSQSAWQRNYLIQAPPIMKTNVWEDLGIIAVNAKHPDRSLVNLLAQPKTILGQMQLGVLLVTPTTDVRELQRRQSIIRYFKDNKSDGLKKLNGWLEKAREQINNTVQLWNNFDTYSEKNQSLFRIRSSIAILGNSSLPVEMVSSFNKASILGVLTPFFVDWRHRPAAKTWTKAILNLDTLAKIGAVGAFVFGIYRHIAGTLPQQKTVNAIKERLQAVRDVVRLAGQIYDFIQNDPKLAEDLEDEMKPLKAFLNSTGDPDLKEILTSLEDKSITHRGLLSLYGPAVETLIAIINQKNKFADMLMVLGRIDAYLAVSQRLVDHEALNTNLKISFAEFDSDSQTPFVSLKGFWSPFLPVERVITNDIELGGETPRMGVFSGPNAAGKSTLMKAVGYNVLLAQTLGICFGESMRFTPFSNLTTYMNVTDDVLLGQSLFKAEVNRTKKYLDILNGLKENEFSFSILDELFSGTNPKEGEATAYSAVHHIGLRPQVVGLVATHYKKLSRLAERVKEKGVFQSLHVALIEDENEQLNPDFKIYEGHSTQSGAILILKKEGFAPEILDEALEIFENEE